MSQNDVRRVTSQGRVKKDRRFDQRDWNKISEFVTDTLDKRKNDRKDRDKIWKDIDRQLAMTPDISHKLNANGTPDPDKDWLPEVELPLQAETLEMLSADANRMMFPTSGSWHEPHAALTDKYLGRVDMQSLIAGDENSVPSRITQDNADKLVQGIVDHWHRQYDFFGHVDQINSEAFKYGIGMARCRMVTKRVMLNTAKGIVKLNQQIPALLPVSIRNTYPDDSQQRLMNEGHYVGPSTVRTWRQLLTDIHLAASRGGTDPNDPNGGWMPKQLAGVDADKDGAVEVIEMEGDFVVPRQTTENFYLPNAVVTVLVGKAGKKAEHRVIRWRFNKYPFSSYIEFPYHKEHIDSAYATSPLMKGHPIQVAAVAALSRLMEAAALNTQPPTQYDSEDREFASTGGPKLRPGALLGTIGDIRPLEIGDPTALFNMYAGLLQQYSNVTGITAPRLGQQTVSHTTAFAKEAELNRGTIRTVDYVKNTLKGPMTEWLHKAYVMGRDNMGSQMMYIDAYNGFVEITKDDLPDAVVFEAHGSGAPAEEAQKQQERFNALQLALQVDAANIQTGGQPTLDVPKLVEQIMRTGGWTDVDTFLNLDAATAPQAQQQLQAVGGSAPGVLTQGVPGAQ